MNSRDVNQCQDDQTHAVILQLVSGKLESPHLGTLHKPESTSCILYDLYRPPKSFSSIHNGPIDLNVMVHTFHKF